MIRTSSTGELMVLLQCCVTDEAGRQQMLELLQYVADTFPQITSLLYVINNKLNDTISDLDVETFKGNDYIYEEMEGLRFKVGPKSFYQTNSEQAYNLYKVARDFAGLTGNELVYDLYTGTGTIANFVARKSRQADIAGRAFAAAEAAQNEEAAGLAFALWKELDPDNSRVRLLRTGELFTKGQFEEAGKIAQGLLAESDDPAALLENIMQLSSGVEEKARLYETLSPIFSKNNEDARVELVLASLAASAKMREEARKHGAAAIELAPNNPHILLPLTPQTQFPVARHHPSNPFGRASSR